MTTNVTTPITKQQSATNADERMKIILRRVIALADAQEREIKADYRRKIEYVRSATAVLRVRVERGVATEEEIELLAECEAALAADAAGEMVMFVNDIDEETHPDIPPLPAGERGIEVRKQAMPVHGYNPGGMGSAYWFADHRLSVGDFLPRPDDIVEYDGRFYTVIEEVRYLRLIPCDATQSRESSRPEQEASQA